PPYVSWLIGTIGWRSTYVVLALTVTVIAFPGVYALFREPVASDMDGRARAKTSTTADVSLAKAIRGYRFWALSIGLLLVAAGISGLITNLVPLLIDKGLDARSAAAYS